MGSTARMASGWIGEVRITNLLKVITRGDRFVVRVADTEDLTVMARDITAIKRQRRLSPTVRIEHTAQDVPSPIVLILQPNHPARRDIEQLRPDVVTTSRWQFTPAAVTALVVGLLGMAAALVWYPPARDWPGPWVLLIVAILLFRLVTWLGRWS